VHADPEPQPGEAQHAFEQRVEDLNG
jgi:hypothetical protein